MIKNKYLSLVLILLFTFIASAIGGFTTAAFKEPWYSEIILPSFNPPSKVFAPVWTILYILMSVAIWRIWMKFSDRKVLNIYFYHLLFNATWSVVFFGHLISIILGFLINKLIGISFVSLGLSVGVCVSVMMYLKIVHPPAAANPLIALYADISYDFIIFPVITGSIVLILFSFFINRFVLRREYPKKWF